MPSKQRRVDPAILESIVVTAREVDPPQSSGEPAPVAIPMPDDPVLALSVPDFMRLVPGTGRNWWRFTGLKELEAKGAIRRMGHRWIGRRSAIEAALLATPPTRSSEGGAG